MKNYSITSLFAGATVVALVFIFNTSCTPVDYTLGENLIPDSQQMNTGIDSNFRVETSLFKLDSINASNNKPTSVSVGSYVDPLVGGVSGQAFSEFSTVSFGSGKELKTEYFGINPVCDSIFLYLDVIGAKGDTTIDRQFEIYRVSQKFHVWKYYYTNFVMPSSALSAEPFVTFKARKADIIKIPLPMDFARELMETTQDPTMSPYYNDSLFHEKFKGFYFRGNFTASAADPGNMININMTSGSKIQLYYRNDNPAKKDTASATYHFQVNGGNASIEMVQHDYSLSNQAAGGINPAQIGQPEIQTEYCYAQGMAGVGTMINLSTPEILEFKARIQSQWPGFTKIAINRAVLRVNMVTRDWVNYNKSYVGLGLYYDIVKNKFIPDYNPLLLGSNLEPAPSHFDGLLNRSLGYYEMDITSYFQRLINSSGDGSVQRSLEMLPNYDGNLLIQRSQMYGSAAEDQSLAPQMIITYTVLR